MKMIEGGVTAAQGFVAGGIHCGVRKNKSKPDLAMIYSEKPCAAAAVYTQNLVKGAPILVTQKNIADGAAKAVICNSGNANTCNADGEEKAQAMCDLTAQALGIAPQDVVVASTGVIGQVLPIEPIQAGIPELVKALSADGSHAAATAIMTTDTIAKEAAAEVEIGGKTVKVGGISKGSGMIHPNMATMLCFVTTDCAISPAMLDKAIHQVTEKTFNMISVDGDTSTNDTCVVLANGLAGNTPITGPGADYDTFFAALRHVCEYEAKMIASDGEGAGRLVTCTVQGAETEEQAEQMAKAVVRSPLVKCAMFGSDANWGRVLCAIGYSGAEFDPKDVAVSFQSKGGALQVCAGGQGVPFDEDLAKKVLGQDEVTILVTLTAGQASCSCWGCDLTYDYVKINGDYRS